MTIDISAELIEVSNNQYYADWGVDETQSREDETTVKIVVTGYDDAEYLDLTPVFDILKQTHSSVGDSFFLQKVAFNPRRPTATLTITTDDIRSEETLTENYAVTRKTSQEYLISEDVLAKIDYVDVPLLVGYCSSDTSLAIELR